MQKKTMPFWKDYCRPRYKDEIENIQSEFLAPYAAVTTAGRRYKEESYKLETRSEFQHDRDRIIHSKAFRRLLYKTQVFVNHEGDHYRTRLTHSMEAAQIARSISRCLGLNEDLTEAISLGHDLGHTPFGHAVEGLLDRYLKEEGGFLHNQHGVRVVDILENKPGYPQGDFGLNLTWEVREGILKHTGDSSGIYADLCPDKPGSLESQVVYYADKIAYICHDLEDAMSAGIIDELKKSCIIGQEYPEKFWYDFGVEKCHIDKGVSPLIGVLTRVLTEETIKVISRYNIDSTEKVRKFCDNGENLNRIVTFGPFESRFKELKGFVYKYIYSSPVVSVMDVKAVRVIRKIFHTYKRNPEQLPYPVYDLYIKTVEKPEKLGNGYLTTPLRVICDYIASMTDRYAIEEYDRLFNPHSKVYKGVSI